MPKRGENIYKRKDGRWEGRIWQYCESGKKSYRSVYGKSYREVKDKVHLIKIEMQKPDQNNIILKEAADLWMKSKSSYWKAGTYASYKQILNKYVIPDMGNISVKQISNRTLLDFASKLNKREKSLSRNYVFQICAMVCRILRYMNKQYGIDLVIPDNPISKEQVRHILLPSESSLNILADYLRANSNDDTCLGILIALHTGIRVGELSALTWKDIDLEEEILYVRRNMLRVHKSDEHKEDKKVTQIVAQKPKSMDSIRIIPIPSCLLSILRKYKKDDQAYVVSGVKASWAEPRTIQYRFENILKKCQIEYFNFHMLRHAFATRCVSMGLDVKSLSEILGHSNIQLTLNLYVHSTIQQKRLLMQQYNSIIHQ